MNAAGAGRGGPAAALGPCAPAQALALADDAWLLRLGDRHDPALNARVHALAAHLRQRPPAWLGDVVPAYASLAVFFDPCAVSAAVVRAWLLAAVRAVDGAGGDTPLDADTAATARMIELPVAYGGEHGPDLAASAAELGLDPAELVRRHCAATYTVAMIGFAPGFPYLSGLDPALALPRLATPRTAVAAGSVAIGGAQTGIYPRPGPGGWRLLGRTPWPLFDPAAAEPSLLRPGDRVRFRAIDANAFERIARQNGLAPPLCGPDGDRADSGGPSCRAWVDAVTGDGLGRARPDDDRTGRPSSGTDDLDAGRDAAASRPRPPLAGRARQAARGPAPHAAISPATPFAIEILAPGPLTSVQDLGRDGWRHLGVARGGALDPGLAALANRLVGNPDDAALLELSLHGPRLRLLRPLRIALLGAHVDARLDGEAVPGGRPVALPPGELRLGGLRGGARAWLALAGGVDVARLLGSRSTDLRGGFGGVAGRALRAGDRLALGQCGREDDHRVGENGLDENGLDASGLDKNGLEGRGWNEPGRPPSRPPGTKPNARGPGRPGPGGWGPGEAADGSSRAAIQRIRAPSWWIDPEFDPPDTTPIRFRPSADPTLTEALAGLARHSWRVHPASDRQGLRLDGAALPAPAASGVSEPVAPGTLQLPPDGHPIVLLADAQTVGGYPRLGHVIAADLPRLAQAGPHARLRLAACDAEEAAAALRQRQVRLARLALAVDARLRRP